MTRDELTKRLTDSLGVSTSPRMVVEGIEDEGFTLIDTSPEGIERMARAVFDLSGLDKREEAFGPWRLRYEKDVRAALKAGEVK